VAAGRVKLLAMGTRAEGDVISFQGTGLNSFAAVLANSFQVGYGVLVIVDADTQVAIFGQTLASLQATDFAFS
jgi:hypothetical protein